MKGSNRRVSHRPRSSLCQAGILLEDDATAVFSNNVAGVAKKQGQDGAAEHENDEADLGAVRDGGVGFDVDVLAQGNLITLHSCSAHIEFRTPPPPPEGKGFLTKLPMTAPMLKMPQNRA